jgi:Ni,Fe-hydrogenase III large subunit
MSPEPPLAWTRSRDFRVRPLPTATVSPADWRTLAARAANGSLTLLALWAEAPGLAMVLHDPRTRRLGVARLAARRGEVPSIGDVHPAAQRLERAAADLAGLTFARAPDPRPWLDHGRWGIAHPLGKGEAHAGLPAYPFLPVEGESLHQVPVGPVHAGIIEPGHFRFTAQGETVVRLEERLGYTHKGIERLMQGADLVRGARLAGRVSGDSTVAYAWAFAQAAEAALEVEVPPRALALRGIMAELERLANHLGDFGAICNDAAFAMMLAQTGVLREEVLRAARTAFGHRYMRDLIVPGGTTADLDATGEAALRDLIERIRDRLPVLVDLYDNTASLLDRTVGTGRLDPVLATGFGAGGFVGRASGRDFDTRRDLRYAPYDMLTFEVPVRTDGDVNARVWLRLLEAGQCLSLITQLLNTLPAAPVRADVAPLWEPRSGLGLVEGFRGDVLVWLSLDARGRIRRCHLRDPSWFQWPLLEAAIEGNIIADFPLCNKSFNCSYSGHDL